MRIVREVYRSPTRSGEVEYTINLNPSDLCYFTATASDGYMAQDRAGLRDEAAKSNVCRVWRSIGLEPPKHFACLCARVAGVRQADLSVYGPVVLVVDPERIKDDAYIVNGDFKDVAYKLQVCPGKDIVRWFQPASPNLALELKALADNARSGGHPRLIGSYFEARIRRPIVRQDILDAYVPPGLDVPQNVIDQLEEGMI